MANYPNSLDTLTNPAGTQTLDAVDHAGQHSDANDIIEAIESVLGTTAGTSVLKDFSAGDFPARINTSNVLQQTIQGTVNSSVIGTPAITGGTSNSHTLGTPTVVLGSDATGDLYYRGSGTTVTRLGIGSSGQYLTTDGTTPSWGTVTTSSFSGARVTNSGSIVLTDSTLSTVTFDTEIFDTDSYHGTTNTERLTCTAGTYNAKTNIIFNQVNINTNSYIQIERNGTMVAKVSMPIGGNPFFHGAYVETGPFVLADNDYFLVAAYQDNSATANKSIAAGSWFTVERLQ